MADVCVIGAGPAGSTLAARMAQLGHQVHLVERKRFPRGHLGESLSPGVMTLLQAADMHETVAAAGFPGVSSVWVEWGDGPRLRENQGEQGLLVDRGEFDLRLLERARAFGVRIYQPAQVIEQGWNGAKWRLAIDTGGTSKSLDVDFVADAGGRRSISPRRQAKTAHRRWRSTAIGAAQACRRGHGSNRARRWYGRSAARRNLQHARLVDPNGFRSAGAARPDRFCVIHRSGLMRNAVTSSWSRRCAPSTRHPISAARLCRAGQNPGRRRRAQSIRFPERRAKGDPERVSAPSSPTPCAPPRN